VARFRLIAVTLFVTTTYCQSAHAQFGAIFSGIGPVNRSMGGASTAAPIDTLGAFQWNPATITALPSTADLSLELLFPRSELGSSIDAGALGGGIPPVSLSGSDRSKRGVFPMPSFGVVYQPEEPSLSFGLGVLFVGGFSANFPGSTTNPILTAPPPAGLGVGPVYSQYQLMQMVPTIAFRLTEQLSIGFSPIIDLAGISADPGFLAAPDDANGNGQATYPPLTHGIYQWGAGFQVGAYYVTDTRWQFGASFKSTQWFQSFDYNSRDEIGGPRNVEINVDVPMIVSIGAAYAGFERLLLAVDARYIDYANTRGFSDTGFDAAGAVRGLGWDNIFAVSTGAQYQVTDALSARLGYSFNTNPIDDANTFFNILSPLVIQHTLSVGASWNVTDCFKISAAYSHYFENSIAGPLHHPMAGPLAGTRVSAKAAADSVTVGASLAF
jgi:long-chain fatty acid transport protein